MLLEVEGDQVRFDLFIVADANANLREVGREVQDRIARAVRDMVGMSPESINVHFQNVEYPELESKQNNL